MDHHHFYNFFTPTTLCHEGIDRACAGLENEVFRIEMPIGFDSATRAGEGGFGEAYKVAGWLPKDAPAFPGAGSGAGLPNLREGPSVCLKVFMRASDGEPEEEYKARARGEYERLVSAMEGGASTPYPLAFGKASTPTVRSCPDEGRRFYYAVAMSWVGEEGGSIHGLDSCVSILEGDRGGGLGDRDVAELGLAIAEAVSSLHACETSEGVIVHRDLWPPNVFVDLRRGQDGLLHPGRSYLIDLSQSTLSSSQSADGICR